MKFFKPKTRIINGVKCPIPLSNLDKPTEVYIVNILSEKLYNFDYGFFNESTFIAVKKGLCFTTAADAVKTAKAILKGLEV